MRRVKKLSTGDAYAVLKWEVETRTEGDLTRSQREVIYRAAEAGVYDSWDNVYSLARTLSALFNQGLVV